MLDPMNISRFSSSPPEDNLSVSQCKLLTNSNINESPIHLHSFGPKLSLLTRQSIENNHKIVHSDSMDTQKDARGSLDISQNKRSISNSLNCTKNNLHIDTADQNGSEDSSFRNFMQENTKKNILTKSPSMRLKRYERYLDNVYFNLFITLVTIYALFASDIQAAAFQAKDDNVFDILSLTSMGIFLIEILLSFVIKSQYRFSFFFWLDLISTFSLLLDVTLVQDALFLEYSISL